MPCATLRAVDEPPLRRPSRPTQVVELHLPASWTRRALPLRVAAMHRPAGSRLGEVLDSIDRDLAADLPERLRQHPACAILVEAARRAVILADDLFRHARYHRVDPADACTRIAALYDLAIAELTVAGGGLLRDPDLGADRTLARAWLLRLRRTVAEWVQERSAASPCALLHQDANDPCPILLRVVPV